MQNNARFQASLSRSAYEGRCSAAGFDPMTDTELLTDYSVQFGDFWGTQYSDEIRAEMALHRERRKSLVTEQSEQSKRPEPQQPALVSRGQIWEKCACGSEPVNLPSMLCDKCQASRLD